jgi:cell division protease FtsH
MALGVTMSLPERDKYLVSEKELLDDIAMSLGGRCAEELVYGETWTGSSSDLERVTRTARAMVCAYGMSEKLGTLALGRRNSNPFMGRDMYEDRNYSEEVAKMIDQEVRSIVDRCQQRAVDLLTAHRTQLDAVVHALLERETLDRPDFLKVMAGQTLPELVLDPKAKEEVAEPIEVRETEKGGKQLNPPRFEPGPA